MEIFLLYTLGIAVGVFLLYIIGVSIAPYAPDPIKNDHFECGLPASSSTPKKANFGFFFFAIAFIIADMSGLFFTLFVYTDDKGVGITAAVFALILAIAIFISMREYRYVENI